MASPRSEHTPKRNIELKARCRDLAEAAARVQEVGATPAGELRQLDTYFVAPHGRLKLRETDGRPAELIAYERPNELSFCESAYYVLPVPEPQQTRAALANVLGLRGEVRKRRMLWLWHNVRIHLDEVTQLGTFVEFEAVLSSNHDEATSRQRLAQLRRALEIREEDLIAVSYSDLAGL